MYRLLTSLFALVATAALGAPSQAAEAGSQAAFAKHAMVSAANPLAVQAGVKILREGGSAVDAAVAVQAVLGLVEPQSSGLGGGAYMVYYDARTRRVTAYDGREVAPQGATPELFLTPDGQPMNFFQAVLSGRSTGVPGAVAMLGLAHDQHGKKPWRELFGDAERLASDGFVVSPRLAGMIMSRIPQASAPDVVAYFSKPDGSRTKAGDLLKNPAYAATLRRLAAEGAGAFYAGPIAEDIAARVQRGPMPGTLSVADIKAYQPKVGPAQCRPYRIYVVCVPRDPSGGTGLLEALGLLQRTDIDKRGSADPEAWSQFAQASRLMYADRDTYIGDPAFVTVPTEGLLDPAYLDARAKLITEPAGPPPAPGHPRGAPATAADATAEPGGTSHFVIVDATGDVLSMTTTVESVFGSGRMADGFMLNNQLTDFSFRPRGANGAPVANAPAAGKRPRSSMAPAIVLDRQGRFVAALGSPGGNSILAFNLKGLVGVLDWRLPMQTALALPNLIARGASVGGETDKFAPGVVEGLAARGIAVSSGGGGEGSGLHGVEARNDGLEGGADPRREGVALGF
jgi:gamma-glutamyltranspeptidase/glutathione hydrolase